jgi:hypothetical protein
MHGATFPDRASSTTTTEPVNTNLTEGPLDSGSSIGDQLIAVGFKEVEYVLELEPEHLWLVGPGTVEPAAHVWSVTVDGLNVGFRRLPDLPPGAWTLTTADPALNARERPEGP